MAFKGTWHRGDSGGGSSVDRRYASSTESLSSFVLPPQSVPGNQMSLGPMSYQANPNTMYSVISTVRKKNTIEKYRTIVVSVLKKGSPLMSSTNYSSTAKSLPYTGTVSNMCRDFGVIDNEISFKFK